MATRNGARALRIDEELGTLEPGKRADVIVLDGSRLAGPLGEPAARIVFGGGGRAVRDVFVDGVGIVRDGAVRTIDTAESRAKAGEAANALLQRASLT
jgi:cytosine/adenosine deaminase-related metal-dependent hydrolase